MRFEGYVGGALRFLDVNEGGTTSSLSLSTIDSSVRIHESSFAANERAHDFLAGLPMKREDAMSVDGRPADTYRVDFPNHGGEKTADYALIWVDKETSLRFREEWVAGTEVVRVVTRSLVPLTPRLEALLSVDSVSPTSQGALEGLVD